MEIRPYRQGDEKAIMELDARVLPSEWNRRTLENWYWKFTETNPSGPAFIWIAEHNGKIIAHFAAVPYRLKVGDREITASHTIGALVEHRFQNRGVLKLVGDRLLEELVQHQIPYTWGFPNRRAYRFEKTALGYEDLIRFDEWHIPVQKISTIPDDPGVQGIEVFHDDFDRLWEACSADYEIAVVRNAEYLKWRFANRPDWDYYYFGCYDENRLSGYVVLKLYREEDLLRGHIIDIFARRDDRKTLSRLIRRSMKFFVRQEVDEITVWIWGSPVIEEIFTLDGFTRREIDRPLILRINVPHAYRDKILDNSRWYFTMGDSTEIF